ncbi:uncharacterized protein [Epargyreus clarus]|uniref:uncharacterized protein n=1 Tax=Epargyreus clarus TaxID=520877 RepID=UPI003C2ECABB
MSSVSDLLANQQQLASAIESVYTNFKKDGASRKTAEYIKKRLDLLDRYWFEYEANYSRLSGMDLDANVRDFINKDLEGMNERYGNIKGHIQSSEVAAAERPQSPLLKPPTFALKPQGQADLPQITPQQGSSKAASQSSSSTTSLTEDMLRKQQSNFKAFHRTIEYIHVEDISERWELEDSLRTVQSRWSIIDTLHWELDSQLNGSNEDYERAFASYERKYQDIKRAITTFTDYVETVKKPRELPDLKEFLEFLEAKFTSLESLREATLPTAQQTQLGWILSGNVKTFQCNVVINNLEEIQRFWEIEDIADSSELSLEDEHCLNFYQDTTARRKDGRYEVRLPLKPGYEEKLGESKPKAIAQFYQLEKKINKQPEILESYKLFMHEYLKLIHMTTASGNSKPNCYLPHHCVRREDSTTTKLRVVFNASAITSSSMSLNDLMFRGPNLQHDLQDIIIAWRQYKYAYTADLEKMFRQIWLHSSDQNLQKIIWRNSPLDHLREYQLATVTYGTKAAPFLAMMTLRQLARDEKSNYPDSMAPEVLESSFYMDDLVHGSHTPEEAKQLQVDLINILNSGGFNIRKWKSNLPELVKGVNSDSLNPGYDFKQPESTKTLGLGWNPEEDQFTFQLQISLSSARPTKRSLLSDTSKVFDPLVLGWLNGDINRWKPFVANRVRQVTELMPPDCWQYVASKENPADCASRGLTACQLKEHKLWWEGPTWLTMYTPENKNQPLYVTNEDMKKVKQANVVLSNRDEIIEKLIDKQSSLSKTIRILAWVLRFKRKAQKHAYLTLQELTKSRNLIIKYFQDKHFIDEMDRLKECKTVSSSSKIYNLNPKIDEHGILRVGVRLKHANIDCDMKYPVIIPNNTRLSDLIIDETHKLTFHGGARLTTAFIRRKYWIIGGNNATKKGLRRCVQCKKQSPILERQLMGDLPSARINPSRPFSHCGIDYTGHVSVKANKGRGIRTNKGYVAVFVCMATKAVHLELVSDLTTSAFLAALHRMVARRGVPDHIYSDQGKNFIGADNALRQQLEYIKNTYNEELMTELTSMGIEWHFNSPSWPSAGGLWEAAVKSLKHHLKRVLGDQKLTFEEFTTLLSRIEGCLNSRPLCPLTEDPDDLNFLTPSHFLSSGPVLTIYDTENDLRTRWHLTQ